MTRLGLDAKVARLLNRVRRATARKAAPLPAQPGNDEIKRVRQALIQMAPKYTFGFVQMVHDHQAARRRDLEELVRTQTMVQILKRRSRQIPALIAGLPEELSQEAAKD